MISKKVVQEKVRNSVYWEYRHKTIDRDRNPKNFNYHRIQTNLESVCAEVSSMRCRCGVKGL